jgi:hypothetical protein
MIIQLLQGSLIISNNKGVNLTITKIFTADINTIIHIYPDKILKIDNMPSFPLNKSTFYCTKINSIGKIAGDIINIDSRCNIKLSDNAEAVIFPEDYYLGSERTIKLKSKFYSFKDLQDLLWAENIKEYFLKSEYKIEETLQSGNYEIGLKEDIIKFKNCVERKLVDASSNEIERINYLSNLIQDGPNSKLTTKVEEEQEDNYIMHLVNNVYKFFFNDEPTILLGSDPND